MKQSEVKVGGEYQAKVSGNLVTVELLEIYEIGIRGIGMSQKRFRVRNLKTNRIIDFRSATRLRPLPAPVRYFLDTTNQASSEINRSEAVNLVHTNLGIGTWLVSLRQARTADGLVIAGIGTLRVR